MPEVIPELSIPDPIGPPVGELHGIKIFVNPALPANHIEFVTEAGGNRMFIVDKEFDSRFQRLVEEQGSVLSERTRPLITPPPKETASPKPWRFAETAEGRLPNYHAEVDIRTIPEQLDRIIDAEDTATVPPETTFDRWKRKGLAAATAVADQRGAEYGDSWGETDPAALRCELKRLANAFHRVPRSSRDFLEDFLEWLTPPRLRRLALAAVYDIKSARRATGEPKDDTDLDQLNYLAALIGSRLEDAA